jgi:hypothetical protein
VTLNYFYFNFQSAVLRIRIFRSTIHLILLSNHSKTHTESVSLLHVLSHHSIMQWLPVIITEEKCDGTVSLWNWSQLWPETMEVEPLVINGFIDDITPAQRPGVPFVSIFCIRNKPWQTPGKGATTIIHRFTYAVKWCLSSWFKENHYVWRSYNSMDTNHNASLNKILHLFEEPLQPSTRQLHYA